ncbi:hypothetical protein PVK06_001683 [Gossypium arboreum]|uniref:Uncharacterized protein n=1 Tax=Gossypium arboreum TaxID=29729 RepID=A0ABR0R2M9_GOSAR|nr:hypothetical protein PVK06_001683 [Gossypium arboreum]
MKRVLIKGSSFTAHKFLHSYSKINQNPDHSFTLLTASTRSRLRFYSSRPDSPIEKKPDPVIESTSVAVKDIALPIEDVSNKDHRIPKLEAQLVVYNSPILAIQR